MARTKPRTRAKAKPRRNLDLLTTAAGLSAFQSARDLGWLKSTKKRNPEDIEFLNEMAPYASKGHIEFTSEGIERYVREGIVYQAFSNTPVYGDGYRMGTPERYAEPSDLVNLANSVGYARNPRRLRNPADIADAVYEEFHGAPPEETLEIQETERVHAHLAGLGDLVCIVVKLSGGTHKGEKKQLNAPDPGTAEAPDIVRVACNEAKNQMYLVGGDQSISVKSLGFRDNFDIKHDGETFETSELKDLMVIGEIHRLTYRTEKHFDQFEEIDYFHKVGEDTKVRPFLLYDTMNDRMKIAGGEYTIHERGIVN